MARRHRLGRKADSKLRNPLRLLDIQDGPYGVRPPGSPSTRLAPDLWLFHESTNRKRSLRSLPSVDLSFSSDFRYAGGQRFVLYQIADAEQHFLVDADENKRVRRFFWVQFEHFLPSNREHYDYKPLRQTTIDDLTFICDSKLYADYARFEARYGLRWSAS
jgi:hypothetical protein